jgi:hypothetical protein
MNSTRALLVLLLLAASPTIAGENQLLNPDFGSGIEHWSVFGSTGTVSYDGARGSPSAGSARLSCTNPGGLAIYQCFPTTGNLNQRFAGRLRLAQGSPGTYAGIALRYYASEDCSGSAIGGAVTSENLGSVAGVPVGETYAVLDSVGRSPAAARSAWFFAVCDPFAFGPAELLADHLLTEPNDIFTSSFE